MKIGLNWLKRYVDVSVEPEVLSDIFTSLGFEVESVENIGLPRQDSLVVGEIQKIDQHPNADKLSLCEVFVGDNDVRQIVCGAKNFKLFDHVPVALPGTVLLDGTKINESKLRGIQSNGMMCSARELGLGDDHGRGLLILDKNAKIGSILHDVIAMQDDTIFDLSVTSNRGDCLSYIGVARELACKLNLQLKLPKYGICCIENEMKLINAISVISDNCSCYNAFCIGDTKVAKSPDWLIKDLNCSGIKSINNVVDICNWVMLETGNPMHAFDIKKISGNVLNVRQANSGESLLGLDGKDHILNESIAIIADSKRPLVIAGIIGSTDAEIDETTTDILIECACFDRASIMKSSRMLGLLTDSSYRFSRSVNASMCESSGQRAVNMILEICGGQYVQNIIAKEHKYNEKKIAVCQDFFTEKLGFVIPRDRIIKILSSLGFEIDDQCGRFIITVPSHRQDVERPIDLVEECLRVYGTDKIPAREVSVKSVYRSDNRAYTFSKNTRQFLSANGFYECYNYSLVNSLPMAKLIGKGESIFLKNSLLSDQDCYRPSLFPGLLSSMKLNIQNGNFNDKFFEIGKIGVRIDGKFHECLSVGFIASESAFDRRISDSKFDFFSTKKLCYDALEELIDIDQIDLKSIVSSEIWQPEFSAEYRSLGRSGIDVKCGLLNKRSLKSIFDIKANIFACEIIVADQVFDRKISRKTYKPFTQFPRVTKDVSVIVNRSELAGKIERVLEKIAKKSTSGSTEIERIHLFDVYTGDSIDSSKKALGFEISFRSKERTLTDEEVQNSFEFIQVELSKFYEIRKIHG